MLQKLRRLQTPIIFVIGSGMAAACAILSPVAFGLADKFWQPNWNKLADVGQAYGAASALLSALAVAGVTVSLLYQARTIQQQQIQHSRELHESMLRLVMEDPETYAYSFYAQKASLSPVALRRHLFCVLDMNQIKIRFLSGQNSEWQLRNEGLPQFFGGEVGRKYWESARSDWLGDTDKAVHRFAVIVEDEYRRAIRGGPGVEAPEEELKKRDANRSSYSRPVIIALSAAAGAGVGILVSRRKK